ncbi:hypothetical protein HYU11_04040 [Candidatus Woesearchaeota archaeon]|nr:hypothetical protein [Candidatus Woesearchaeota archaeon]
MKYSGFALLALIGLAIVQVAFIAQSENKATVEIRQEEYSGKEEALESRSADQVEVNETLVEVAHEVRKTLVIHRKKGQSETVSTVTGSVIEIQAPVSSGVQPMQFPDLSPAMVGGSAVYAGEPVTFAAVIENNGNGVSLDFNIKWVMDSSVVGYGSVRGIPANSRRSLQFPWVATPGYHNITLILDTDAHVNESDETNNHASYMFGVLESRLPDLLPTPISARIDGTSAEFESAVLNDGQTNSSAFNIRWVLDGLTVGYGSIGRIPSRSSSMENSRIGIEVERGLHNITFLLDADNHILESDEANNQVSLQFLIE